MLKILLCADNHGDRASLEKILSDNPKCDYYFHLGDSGFNAEEIKPFVSVKGNNDWGNDYPRKIVVEIGDHRILLMHGDGYTYSINAMAQMAKNEKCDSLFFGHVHRYYDEKHYGIRMINPGSAFSNRDGSDPCYCIVTIDSDGTMKSEKKNVW